MIDYVAHAEIVKPQGGFWAQGKRREEKLHIQMLA